MKKNEKVKDIKLFLPYIVGLILMCVSISGRCNEVVSDLFYLDNIKPSVQLYRFEKNTYFVGDSITFRFYVDDGNNVNVRSKCRLIVNNQSIFEHISYEIDTISCTFQIPNYESMEAKISIQSEDDFGNISELICSPTFCIRQDRPLPPQNLELQQSECFIRLYFSPVYQTERGLAVNPDYYFIYRITDLNNIETEREMVGITTNPYFDIYDDTNFNSFYYVTSYKNTRNYELDSSIFNTEILYKQFSGKNKKCK